MSKATDDLASEYDFSKGIRGKYIKRYSQGTNIVVLSPDVSKAFPDSNSVNEALRSLIHIAAAVAKATSAGRKKPNKAPAAHARSSRR